MIVQPGKASKPKAASPRISVKPVISKTPDQLAALAKSKGGSGSKAPASKTSAAAQTAWQGDPTYVAARGALQSQLGQYDSNLASQANRYEQQYGEDLGRLGLQNAQGAAFTSPDVGKYTPAAMKVSKAGDSFTGTGIAAPKQASGDYGTWNQIDPLTSSGRAFTQQADDYASRGMTQSSAYVTGRNTVQQDFTNQLHDAQLARNNQLADYGSQAQAYIGQTNDSLNQARLAALSNWNNQQATNAVRAAAGIKA